MGGNVVMTDSWQRVRTGFFPKLPMAAYTAGAIAISLVVLLLPFPPLQDYWEWVYQGALIEQIISHGAENSPFVLRDYPVPNAFSQALIAALSFVASPVVAAKLVILGYIALTAVAYRSLSRIAAPGQAGLAMLVLFSLMIGSQFFNGYINNVYGNLFLVIFFAGLLREKPSLWQTLLFSVLIFFCHATTYAVFGMIIVIYVLWDRLDWRHLAMFVPTGLMFVWYTLRKDTYVEDSLVLNGLTDWLAYKGYTVAKLGPYHNFFFDGVGDRMSMPAWFWAGVGVNCLFILFLGLLAFRTFIRNGWGWITNPAFVSVAVLLAAYPLMPNTVSGVVNIGERFLTIGVLLLLIVAATIPARRELALGAVLASFILPVTATFAVETMQHKQTSNADPALSEISEENRIDILFWHRPYQGADRLDEIVSVHEEGVQVASPLRFSTSIIGPREPDSRDGPAAPPARQAAGGS